MLPLLWKLGKRLMLHRFPCSTVIFFVCIFLGFNYFPLLMLPSGTAARGLFAHFKGIFQGRQGQGFQDGFTGDQ